jgi:hypothetical protein
MVASRLAVLAAAAAPALCAQAVGLSQDVITLASVKRHMRDMLQRQVNYTCQMSINRSERRNPRRNFRLIDSIRLEVALVQGKELFSWPGAGKFDDRELRDMVGGTTSTGSFALHARAVFLGNAATFRYEGERQLLDGRSIYQWAFEVPRISSGYTLRTATPQGPRQAVVGYRGIIQIDTRTFDLIRLQFETLDIPPELGLRVAGDTIEYARVRLGESEYLLPASSDLRMTDLSGGENRNETRFHNCRLYTGDSVIRFDEPPPDDQPPPPPPKPLPVLPPGLSLELQLSRNISLETAAIGEPIEATLVRPARHKGETYLPKGARFSGHIVGVRSIAARVPSKAILFVFEQVESGGQTQPVELSLDDLTPNQLGGFRYAPARIPNASGGADYAILVSGARFELIPSLRLFFSVRPPANGKSAALP